MTTLYHITASEGQQTTTVCAETSGVDETDNTIHFRYF